MPRDHMDSQSHPSATTSGAKRLEFTRFTSTDGPMTKRITRLPCGDVEKDSSPCRMSNGSAVTRQLPLSADGDATAALEALSSELVGLDQNQAIALGVFNDRARDREPVSVTLKATEAHPVTWARSQTNMLFRPGWPALVLLDRDTKWDTPQIHDHLDRAFSGDWLVGVESVATGLSAAALLRRSSTSAGIFDAATGTPLPGGSGEHAYFVAKDGADIPRALAVLIKRLCIADLSALVVSKAGGMLVRALVDGTVASPERLVFEAPPLLGPGLARDATAATPRVRPGATVDTRAVFPPLTAEEEANYQTWLRTETARMHPEALKRQREYDRAEAAKLVARGVPPERAARIVAARRDKVYLGSDALLLDDGSEKNVAEVLANPAEFDEVTCRDPLEPEAGRNKAIIYTNPLEPDREAKVFSQLHGGQLAKLCWDAMTLSQHLEGAGRGAIERLLAALPRAQLEPHELDSLFTLASREAQPGATKSEQRRTANQIRKTWEQRKASRQRDGFAAADNGDVFDVSEGVPEGFIRRDDGWYTRGADGKAPIFLCGPFDVVATVTTTDGAGWSVLIRWQDQAGRQQEYVLQRRLLVQDASPVLGDLADRGLSINTALTARSRLTQLLMFLRPERSLVAVQTPGWVPGHAAFMLPGGAALGPDADRAVLLSPGRGFAAAGSLEGWQRVGQLAAGNPLAVLAICAAFSSPLLAALGGTGTIFHIYGPSSTGKTTVARLFGSVWGPPQPSSGGVMRSWRTTANGLEGELARLSGIGIVLDELKQAPPGDLQAMAYQHGNGTGKSRATRTGEARALRSWALDAFSTGEIDLGTALARAKDEAHAGAQARFMSIPVVRPRASAHGVFAQLHGAADGAAFVAELDAVVRNHHGHAGPAFVSWLAERFAQEGSWAFVEALQEEALYGFDLFLTSGSSGQVRRVAEHFARLVVAGQLGVRAGLLPWDENEPLHAICDIFGDWLAERGGDGDKERTDAIARVRDFLLPNLPRFAALYPDGEDGDEQTWAARVGPYHRQAGYREADGYFLINTTVWREEIHHGHDGRAAARALRDAGLLTADKAGSRLTWRRKIKDVGRPQFYRVSPAVLEVDD
jgi:uncharacterized protein (DUF927 family)